MVTGIFSWIYKVHVIVHAKIDLSPCINTYPVISTFTTWHGLPHSTTPPLPCFHELEYSF